MRKKWGIVLLALFCCMTVSGFSEEVKSFSEGVPFSLTLKMEIPRGSQAALQSYLDTLLALRPLPDGYLLESYKINPENNTIELTGRAVKAGEYSLFLGAFLWDSRLITFPQVKLEVKPLARATISPDTMLLPYPAQAFKETASNIALTTGLMKSYLDQGVVILQRQKIVSRTLIGLLFLAVVSPFLFFTLRRKVVLMRIKEKEISPQEELIAVKTSKDWSRLLALLQRLSGKKDCLTSYELSQFFARTQNKNLERAAECVEQYGYRPEPSLQQFNEAVETVSRSLI